MKAARVGDYELKEKIGEGGMGEVYLAVHAPTGTLVAVKRARPALLATPGGAALFRDEIRKASRLDHPNVVRVFPSSHDDEQPYFVMPLFEGGTLEDRQNVERYRSPTPAVELTLSITAGVQHAHAHGVLHCDLKPSNILFDLERVPHVCDFGLARLDDSAASGLRLVGGTPGWQSPEQAAGRRGSAASDVFQLGTLLFWLLEGELPRPDYTSKARRPWAPTLECAVEEVLQRALAPNPEARYQTAAAFAEDLELALAQLPLRHEASRPLRRLVRWAHRQKLAAAVLVSAACLLVALPFWLDSVLAEARGWIRQQNQFAARSQALAVRNQLQMDAVSIERAALDEGVQALLGAEDRSGVRPELLRHLARFDSLFLLSPSGEFEARTPLPPTFNVGVNYGYRDYHRCALGLGLRRLAVGTEPSGGLGVCVSRVYRSNTDDHLKLSLGAPLFEDGRMTGVIVGAIQARDRFGGLEMRCGPGQCMTALLGPRDRDAPEAPLARNLVVLAHPSLKQPWMNPTDPKDERRLDPGTVARVCRELRCEADPDTPFGEPEHEPIIVEGLEEPVTRQRSVVALAPVGRTGLVVMVATPDAAIEELRTGLHWAAWLFLWLPPLVGITLLTSLLLGLRLRRVLARGERLRSSPS